VWRLTDVETAAIAPADYADALARLHASFREIDLEARHLADRVTTCTEELRNRGMPSELRDADRELLSNTLRDLTPVFSRRGIGDQLLHGEPHPGNVLSTREGSLFVDLGGCCRGPVEFDLAHTPPEVAEHYPGADHGLIHQCRILMWVFLTNCRWWRDDQLSNRGYWRVESLNQLRAALAYTRS
jgi:Ser/Thr protein kinase RdoA (MazF antagonist)